MSNFSDFHDISARFDALIHAQQQNSIRVPISKKHKISMSITRIGLFKTGGIRISLLSINKFGALFSTSHHSLVVSKNMTVELYLNGRCFQFEAHIVQSDAINNLYGIKFEQSLEAIDDYLSEFYIHLHHTDKFPQTSSVWLDLALA